MTETAPANLLVPVILSGGAGTRLWPLSRSLYPKQLLPLTGERSLIQETALRVADRDLFAAPVVVCNEEHRFVVAEQLREAGIAPAAIVLEPVGRNTAPAAAVAARLALREDPAARLLILPSDHHIARPDAFREAVARARGAAAADRLVAFGIVPTAPETGYGYIRRGQPCGEDRGVDGIAEFVEKPDAARAATLVADGCLWNSGMFLFPARLYLEELERFAPDIARHAGAALDAAAVDMDFLRLDRAMFEASPANSIDYAVMERTGRAAVVGADMGWSDLGAWPALWQVETRDESGNVLIGDVVADDVASSYIRSEDRLVAAIGLRDMVVVVTRDAVLVTPMDRAQDVKGIVARLENDGRDETRLHPRVYRPWGYYESVDADDGFQVKRIAVYPGRRLSLQKHARRAEHWIVVTGTARVTRDDECFDLMRNQSTFIPLGAVHRLENPGPGLLTLVEVQSGDYLGEDDIVRLEDSYGRA